MKEVSEGIASLFRLMPEQVGPLMTMVTSMLGVIEAQERKALEAVTSKALITLCYGK